MEATDQRNARSLSSMILRFVAQIAFCICALMVMPVQASAWTQLPNGRVAIVVKGVRLALPSSGDLDLVTFFDYKHGKQMTLERVISRPDEAAAMFDAADNVTVLFGNVPSGINYILNEYPKIEIPTVSFGIVIGGNALVSCSYWERRFKNIRASLAATASHSTGWILAEAGGKPLSRLYVFLSDGVPDNTVPGISCDALRGCYGTTCAGPAVSTGYAFNERRIPQQNWLKMIAVVKTIYDSVLIDKDN